MTLLNLPRPSTLFIGREGELARITARLAEPGCQLLTLVGPGGIGKTRLALQAAFNQPLAYRHGVYFVPLAGVGSYSLLPAALGSTLQLTFFGSDSPRVQLVRYLREKQLLLVLDNFEHLIDGTDLLTDILQAAPGVKCLVTSRERLNIQEEWVLTVEGLAFPEEPASGSLESYDAVQLFVQRARQIHADFSLNENSESVRVICQAVEGMPLGLELAATWLRALSCHQIAAHITGPLDFLTSPIRNIPERHRSLRAVFEHSWKLLAESERSVLAQVSVFRGGFDLEAAQAVSGASLSLLAGLVDKSLIRLNSDGRHDLHELLRQYAAEKLTASEAASAKQRHFEYFLRLSAQVEAHQFGAEQVLWFDRMEIEIDNVRIALTWALQNEQVCAGLQLASALGWFFSERSLWKEGFTWFERLLAARPEMPPALHAKVLQHAGALAATFGDMQSAKVLLEQALQIAQETDDRCTIAWSLAHLGHFGHFYSDKTSLTMLAESAALFREMGERMGLSHVLVRQAFALRGSREFPSVEPLLEEAILIADQAGDRIVSGWAQFLLAEMALCYEHDLERAKDLYILSMKLFQEAHFSNGVGRVLVMQGHLERLSSNFEQARRLFQQALLLAQTSPRYNDGVYVHNVIAGLASIAKMQGEFQRAAVLLGTISHYDWTDVSRRFPVINTFAEDVATVRTYLSERDFADAWTIGQGMTPEQMLTYALAEDLSPAPILTVIVQPQLNVPLTDALTRRELDVLNLIERGLSNREIASTLVVAESTVKRHINHLYSKLTVGTRAQAIARARELGLLH